ncbi:MAG: hypothetical protein GX030_06635 [Firmicutes bacterium]|nr:hypothetical protein [Bacillota bacterium]
MERWLRNLVFAVVLVLLVVLLPETEGTLLHRFQSGWRQAAQRVEELPLGQWTQQVLEGLDGVGLGQLLDRVASSARWITSAVR